MQRYTMLRDGTICYRTDEVEQINGQQFNLIEYYEDEDAYDNDAWVRYEDAAALEQRAEQAERRAEDADLRRIEAESRDRGHAAARMRLYNEARQAEAERNEAREELGKTRRALAEAGRMWEKAKQERADAQQLAADFSRQRDESLGIYAKKNAQIAALRAALVRCKPSNADPPCDCCEPCGAGFISRCECDNRDDACNAQTWCVMMSNFNVIEGVLSDPSAAVEAHNAAIRNEVFRDSMKIAADECRHEAVEVSGPGDDIYNQACEDCAARMEHLPAELCLTDRDKRKRAEEGGE